MNQTAWANYTIGGNSTAGNLTSVTNVITDYPLFTSGELDPAAQYNLTVEIAASSDAPYLLDYILAYHFTDPTPILSSTISTSARPSATSAAPTQSSSSKLNLKFVYIVAGLGAGIVLLLIFMCVLLRRICCAGSRKPKSIGMSRLFAQPISSVLSRVTQKHPPYRRRLFLHVRSLRPSLPPPNCRKGAHPWLWKRFHPQPRLRPHSPLCHRHPPRQCLLLRLELLLLPQSLERHPLRRRCHLT